jgi:thioredoxin-dependent peroxiredoxin
LRTQLARNLILREPSLRKNLYDELDPPAAVDAFSTKTIDPTVLSRVSINPLLTAEKGRKEGASMATELAEGAKAPAFELPRDDGDSVSLKDFKGKKLLIYFYPKADTPGCTRESIDFSKLRAEFQKAGTEILGVSADAVAAQDKFKKKHDLKIALLSDETHKMLEAYGVWGKKSMYGRTFMGITRTTFLIGADGRIARIWPKVRVDGHAAEALAAAKAL